MSKLITVIDLGSNKIAAATCGIGRNGKVSVLALENLLSRGVVGYSITDIDKAVEDISTVVRKIKKQEGKRLKKVFVTIRGSDVKLDISRGLVSLSKTSRIITKTDVNRCLEVASMIRLPVDRRVLQTIVKGFTIDGEAGIKNPIGLYGIKLEAESFIVTANLSKIQSITKCIDHAGFLLEGVHLSSMASANSVLGVEEKEKGVLLLDIGDVLTEALNFKDGLLKDFLIVKRGANAPLTELERKCEFSSVVLTGGGALTDGVIEEAEKVFGVPARIGLVRNRGRNLSSQDAIIHTPTLGLIDQIAKEHSAPHAPTNPFRQTLHKLLNLYETYF